jgi:hypothetical protein
MDGLKTQKLWGSNSHNQSLHSFTRIPCGKEKKQEIRHRALIEAIRFCGGVCAYSKRIKVRRSRASNWLNRPEINIPYEYVVLTERITQVSIERLSPFTEEANKAIRHLRASDKMLPITVTLNDIKIKPYPEADCLKAKNALIIGTDKVLICGLEQIKSYQAHPLKQVDAIVLDLESLLLEMRSIKDTNLNLLMSERIAIGLRLEHLLNNQEMWGNLSCCFQDNANNSQPCRICDEVQPENNNKIAHILGFETREHYCLAKQIYLQGQPERLQALDENRISIAMPKA